MFPIFPNNKNDGLLETQNKLLIYDTCIGPTGANSGAQTYEPYSPSKSQKPLVPTFIFAICTMSSLLTGFTDNIHVNDNLKGEFVTHLMNRLATETKTRKLIRTI